MYKHVYAHLANCSVISSGIVPLVNPEPVFLNVYGAQESILRNELRQPYVAWRAGTITLFLLGS